MRRALGVLALALTLPLAACTPDPVTTPTPTGSPTPERDFTVTTTERPQAFDPAAATTGADAIVALSAFQRLMVFHAAAGELKPDAAQDCLYTSPTVYQCELTEGLTFANGNPLTASDVKFSIERAYRLSIEETSIPLLDSLQRVEQVDDLTIRFHLKFADSQFGRALATPAASIVDEQSYDPDAVRPNAALPVGSGPYTLTSGDDSALVFELNEDYKGPNVGGIERIRVAFADDSPAVEQIMAEGRTEVVWRSLDAAALRRLDAEMAGTEDRRTKQHLGRVPMPDQRTLRLVWNPSSAHIAKADVRLAVARALQADRSASSIIPPTVEGSVAAFPVGGTASVAPPKGQRLKLTLSYPAAAPDLADVARTVRDRLEGKAGLSVQLRADAPDADIRITDQSAWVNTAFGWLQAYQDNPLPGSADKLQRLNQDARITGDESTRKALLSEIQQQAAADLTVLPIQTGAETLFVHRDVPMAGDIFGPGGQLGLWGFRRA